MGTKRAALYLRQSLDRAEGIEAQEQRCTALAQSRGWLIIDRFVDNETRASKPRGPETDWARMLPRIGKDFDVIVSVDLDRLLRSTKDLNTLIDLGAQVVTVDGEIDLTSADGEFRATMLAGIGRFETRRASERQKRHKAAKAARGEWHGGIPPYGYAREGKSLVPNPAEVALIHEAAMRLLDRGQSLHSIVVEWNNRGERTRPSGIDEHGNPKGKALSNPRFFKPEGSHWRQTGLRPILLNRAMLGETKAGAQGWEPIMDVKTFDRLTSLLTDPSRKIVHSPGANGGKRTLGGGLTVCGLCGEPLITHSKATGQGKGTSTATLGCLARVHGPSDKHPRVERIRGGRVVMEDTGRVSISHDPLEELVFDSVIAALEDTDRWKSRMAEKSPEIEDKLVALEDRRSELHGERDGVGRAVMLGAWDDRKAKTELERIKTELEDVNRRINDLLGRPMLESIVQEGKLENWRDWPVSDRRSFLRLFIDRIEVGPYPEGFSRNTPRFRNESVEAHAARKAAVARAATAERINIKWLWDA